MPETLLCLFYSFFAIAFALCFILTIFLTVCGWKLFKKLGEPGWACLIPFYNVYVLCKHTWGNGWVALLFYLPSIIAVFLGFEIVAFLASGIVCLISLLTLWRLFKGFGKSDLFCILGLFFPTIAYIICALDNSKYFGF